MQELETIWTESINNIWSFSFLCTNITINTKIQIPFTKPVIYKNVKHWFIETWLDSHNLIKRTSDIFQHQILLMLLQVTFPIKSLQIYSITSLALIRTSQVNFYRVKVTGKGAQKGFTTHRLKNKCSRLRFSQQFYKNHFWVL